MGGGQSKSLPVSISRDVLLKSTTKTRDIVDIIFDFMINNIQLRDFYSLSSPERCKRYVLFIANELYSKFYEFRIFPTLDKSGSIMFRKADDLTNPPEPERRRQQTACLHLAYFYVRIFQIYGALALTLVDDANYTQEVGAVGLMKSTSGVLPLPGSTLYQTSGPLRNTRRRPISISIPKPPTYLQKGGDVFTSEERKALKLFLPLESILHKPRFSFADADADEKPTYSIRVDTGFGRDIPDCKFILTGDATATIKCKSFTLNLTAERLDNSRVKIKFENNLELKRRGEGDDEIELSDIIGQSLLSMVCAPPRDLRSDQWRVTYGQSGSETTIPSIFNHILGKVMNAIRARRTNAMEGLYRNTRKRNGMETGGREYDETRAYGKIFSEIPGTNPHLRLEAIVDGLTRKRKFGHCIGRAIQLLDSAPVFTGQVGAKRVSYVCDPKFSKDSISGSAGTTLSSATGIIALANLFYDSIHPNMLTITVDEKKSLNDYIDFMRKITKTFTSKSISNSDSPDTLMRSLSQSETTPRDRAMCGDKYDNPIVIGDADVQRKVYSVVQALFRYQIVHASKCAEILVQLFEMRKVNGQYSMRIHPNIMKKGMAEINRISVLARTIMVEYYERCEGMYLEGMTVAIKGVEVKPPSGQGAVLKRIQQVDKQAGIAGIGAGVKPQTGQRAVVEQIQQIDKQGQMPTRGVRFENEVITLPTRE